MNRIFGGVLGILLLATAGCNRARVTPVAAEEPGSPKIYGGVQTALPPVKPIPASPAPVEPSSRRNGLVLEPGTSVRVRLAQTLDTKRNRTGDRFSATLDQPILVGNG